MGSDLWESEYVDQMYFSRIYQQLIDINVMDANSNHAKKALVAVVIERVLLKVGKLTYDEVNSRLYEEYHCYLPDCFENPEYLKRVLQDLYGKSSATIIKSIKKELEEYAEQKGIDAFITVLSG